MFPIYINDGESEIPKDDICYIVAKEGIFLKKKLGVMESIAPVQNISILKSIESAAKMHIKKIPSVTFGKVVEFFKEVYKLYQSESMVMLFYNEENKTYKIIIPKQKVTGSSIDYNRGISVDGYLAVGTIHSHASMSAFHSGVDDKDEQTFDGLHITVGNVNCEDFSISASIIANKKRFMTDPEEYINGIKLTKDIAEPQKQYTTKVYRYINGKLQLDEEKSSSVSYTTTKYDKRYISTASKDKIKVPKSWLDQVEKGTYINNYGRLLSQYSDIYDWGDHFDPYAWNRNLPVPTHPGVPQQNQPISPLNVGPIKQQVFKFPTDDELNFIPCLTCKHKYEKILLEEEDDEEEIYKCEKCNTIIGCTDEVPICPNCKTDEYLILIENDKLQDNYVKEVSKPIQEEHDKFFKCQICGNSFFKREKDETCPFCNSIIEGYNKENELESQSSLDSASNITEEEQNKILEAIKNEETPIPIPESDKIPISKPSDESVLKKMFKNVFGGKRWN